MRPNARKTFVRAITECTGDVIFLSDCDDVRYPNKIEIMTAVLESSASAALVLCNGNMVDKRLRPRSLPTWDWRGFHTNSALRAAIEAGTAFVYWLPFFGSRVAFRASAKPQSPPPPSGEFYQREGHDGFVAWVAVCSGIGGERLPDSPLLAYRQHAGQMTSNHLSKVERRQAHRRCARLPKIARDLLLRRYKYYSPRGTPSAIRDLPLVQ